VSQDTVERESVIWSPAPGPAELELLTELDRLPPSSTTRLSPALSRVAGGLGWKSRARS